MEKERDKTQSFLDWIVGTCDRLLFGSEVPEMDTEPELGIWTPDKSERIEEKD